jgi:hypothetical protein
MVRSTAMTTVTTMAAAVLAASAWFGCGSDPAKPPLTPDGPEMTAPIGDDGGAAVSNPPTSAVEEPMSPPPGKAGGSESQTTIGH